MINENIRALIKFRLQQADDSIQASHTLFNQNLYRDSVNRSYYAMFYAVLALLVIKQLGTSKHKGAISLFDREFVKTQIIDNLPDHARVTFSVKFT